MTRRTMCLATSLFVILMAAQAAAEAPKPAALPARAAVSAAVPAPVAQRAPVDSPPTFEKSAAGGTYIHVKNGTNRPLSFCLYVECAGQGTGKFDKQVRLEPGQVAVWRLGSDRCVATAQHNGSLLYRLGLIGTDASGKQHRWGVIGGHGMIGNERQQTESSQPSDGKLVSFRHILVRPGGVL